MTTLQQSLVDGGWQEVRVLPKLNYVPCSNLRPHISRRRRGERRWGRGGGRPTKEKDTYNENKKENLLLSKVNIIFDKYEKCTCGGGKRRDGSPGTTSSPRLLRPSSPSASISRPTRHTSINSTQYHFRGRGGRKSRRRISRVGSWKKKTPQRFIPAKRSVETGINRVTCPLRSRTGTSTTQWTTSCRTPRRRKAL